MAILQQISLKPWPLRPWPLKSWALLILGLLPAASMASTGEAAAPIDLSHTAYGYAALGLFVLAYIIVIFEELLHLRKSKPVLTAAGLIWMLIAYAFAQQGDTHTAAADVRHHLLDFAELMLFLLSAMTFINTMEERNIFRQLRARLVSSGLSLRSIFWMTGLLAFFISPVADNLTTALIMGAVVIAVGAGHRTFISLSCINIVIAANAGGAFSPFGDITTLMVWQSGLVPFSDFIDLFLPSLVNWLVPAAIMSLTLPRQQPQPMSETIEVKVGGYAVVVLFLFTIVLTVTIHNTIHLPPFVGMMTGLGLLKLYGYRIKVIELAMADLEPETLIEEGGETSHVAPRTAKVFDIFKSVERAEWDTLMFFYGVILCVGGLGTIGYLALTSAWLYDGLGATIANVLVGVMSAVVDNIPVMFAVLNMNPDMSLGQWLLVTLTAGVGGSLLSVGSAAGVALMGQARGYYTFMSHLRWSWAIALGYLASIGTHLWLNSAIM